MTSRRGFLASVAALAVAPFTGAFNARAATEPTIIGPVSKYPRWKNYTATYAVIDRVELERMILRTGAKLTWYPPSAPPPRSTGSDRVIPE